MLPLLLLLACADPFYQDPAEMTEVGEILRFEHIDHVSAGSLSWSAGVSVTHGAEVYRVIYSTWRDGLVTASARLAIPDLAPPADGFPVVAHLHGTLGFADECAPSRERKLGFESSTNPIAARMLSQGRVVVEPDYMGLGTPGTHPYTALAPTAASVLDAIRATARFADPDRGIALGPAPIVALEGHSQGGHAVLATLHEAAAYAPELPIAVAVAISAPAAPRDAVAGILQEDQYAGFAALSLLGLGFAHPEVDTAVWMLPGVQEDLAERVEEHCLGRLSDVVGAPAATLFPPEVISALADNDADAVGLGELLDAEDPGGLVTEVPTLVVHGSDDPLLPPELTEALVERIAASGSPVEWLLIEGGDHGTLPWTAREEVFGFLDGVVVK